MTDKDFLLLHDEMSLAVAHNLKKQHKEVGKGKKWGLQTFAE